ncbi:MAG: UDP-3-O-[3-hydroxymyristoyl] N-acetylglucosamine deacetylase [Candidatus Margulisbacteria bacterium GWF2_35_9]|nr:MAG: UDP-3-O-[3-hydroxymyristoyl] N-acetylglucosamine deacetylase [Candidatus Margulisbacteria bacterium GWF2_35_9]
MVYTVNNSFSIEGTGIHSGKKVKITFEPKNTPGIVFRSCATHVEIPLKLKYIKPLNLGTNLEKNGVWIKTIEHLCAVLWFLKISALYIVIEGEEIPIMDGSGRELLEIIEQHKLRKITKEIKTLVITHPIHFTHNDSFFFALPHRHLYINYTINFPNTPIGTQNYIFSKRSDFIHSINPNRTFGNINDVEKLHAAGLALGATMENALVYNAENYISTPRFNNEAVRHKILDLLGDLYSSGYFVQGKIFAYKTSHILNNKFTKLLVRHFSI